MCSRCRSPRPRSSSAPGGTAHLPRGDAGGSPGRGRARARLLLLQWTLEERNSLGLAHANPESSINGSIPTANWSTCKTIRERNGRFTGTLQSPLTDSNRRPPRYHRATRRETRASAGYVDRRLPGKWRNRLRTSDRAWTCLPGLVFPQCSLGFACGRGDCGTAGVPRRLPQTPSPANPSGRRETVDQALRLEP